MTSIRLPFSSAADRGFAPAGGSACAPAVSSRGVDATLATICRKPSMRARYCPAPVQHRPGGARAMLGEACCTRTAFCDLLAPFLEPAHLRLHHVLGPLLPTPAALSPPVSGSGGGGQDEFQDRSSAVMMHANSRRVHACGARTDAQGGAADQRGANAVTLRVRGDLVQVLHRRSCVWRHGSITRFVARRGWVNHSEFLVN